MPSQIFEFAPIASSGQEIKFSRPLSAGVQSRPLSAGVQNSCVVLWAEVNPKTDVAWEVCFIGTGWVIPAGFTSGDFVDTAVDEAGFVWHVLARKVGEDYE